MPADIIKPKTTVANFKPIFCKPLNMRFPQIYRLHRSHRIPAEQMHGACGRWTLESHAEFSLDENIAHRSEVVWAEPISCLAPTDRSSLVLRHHWSRSRAQAYLQGIEDSDAKKAIGGVFVRDEACFTLIRRATSNAWNGPMIFFLADIFEDDGGLGVQSWEMSASCDGLICRSDIFCEAD